MKQKKVARAGTLAMSAGLLASLMTVPVMATGNEPVLAERTTGRIVVGRETVHAQHTYAITKVFDRYVVGKDNDGNTLFQFKLTPAFGGGEGVDKVTFGEFTVDAQTGKITYKYGDPEEEYVLNDESPDAAGAEYARNMNENASYAAKFATALAQYAVSHNVEPTLTLAGGEASQDMPVGYYLIYEISNEADDGLIATKPILADLTCGDALITPKDAKVEIDKTIEDEGAVDEKEKNDYDIGDIINYQVVTNFPVYEADVDPTSLKFEVTDALSPGLTLQRGENDIVVEVEGATIQDGDYTLNSDATGLSVSFKNTFIKANQGATVTVKYKAELNGEAVVSGEGNPNKAVVEFSNNPEVSDSTKKLEDDAKVYTYGLDFRKIDGTHLNLLAGAKFELSNADGVMKLVKVDDADHDVYRPATASDDASAIITTFTTSDKEIRFKGLDAGTYTLTETEAPKGFAKIAAGMSFEITAQSNNETGLTGKATVVSKSDVLELSDDRKVQTDVYVTDEGFHIDATVQNFEGISLPETGAMTSLFVMGAGAVVAGAGIFIAARRKKDEDED